MLSSDIKLIGIAAGNNQKHIDVYRTKFRVQFPLFPDEKKDIYTALGKTGTPFMILVNNSGKVLMTHRHAIEDLDEFLRQIKEYHKKQ
ncbi:MAG: hypothetical protein JSV55_08865, partial [Deltaproteobacteria bacterium]